LFIRLEHTHTILLEYLVANIVFNEKHGFNVNNPNSEKSKLIHHAKLLKIWWRLRTCLFMKILH